MREFVDQGDLRMPLEHRVEIEFLERVRAMNDFRARQNLERGGQPLGFGAAMRFDHARDDISASAQEFRALAQHFEGLADAGCGPQENLETTAPLLLGGLEQRIGGGAGVDHNVSTAPFVTPGSSGGPLCREIDGVRLCGAVAPGTGQG